MDQPAQASAAQSPGQIPAQWRGFLRAMVDELDAVASTETRARFLRSIGARMSRQLPLPDCGTLESLQAEMNEALAASGWGEVRLQLDERRRLLLLHHTGLPRIGWAGDPPGTWLSPVLLGLYETWLSQQPGADPGFTAAFESLDANAALIRYGLA